MSIDALAYGITHHGSHNDEIKNILNNSQDYTAIFLEIPSNFQKQFDEYAQTGIIPEELEGYIQKVSEEGHDIREELEIFFKFSVENKIPLIFIDSIQDGVGENVNKSKIGNWLLKGESRDEEMFETVKRNMTDGGKYLLFVGSGHLISGSHERSQADSLAKRMNNLLDDRFIIKILGL